MSSPATLLTRALCLGALFLGQRGVTNTKLSPPLPPFPEGDVFRVWPSPDGRYLVYDSNERVANRKDLRVVPLDGSAPPRNLTGLLSGPRHVGTVSFTPGNVHLLMTLDGSDPGLLELWTLPLDGSAIPRRLSNRFLSGSGTVNSYELAPDGLTVVYDADEGARGVRQLMQVPLDRSRTPRQLNRPLPVFSDVPLAFRISADGTRVVYRNDEGTDETFELYSAPIDGSALPLRISAPLPAGGDVLPELELAGSRVVYMADQDSNDVFELYSVPCDGSAPPVKLNLPLTGARDVVSPVFVSSDGRTVVFRADQDTRGVVELYSVPADGSALPTKLNGPLPSSSPVFFQTVLLSLDGTRVVFMANLEQTNPLDTSQELYSVPIDGSALPVMLNAPLPPGGGLRVGAMRVTRTRVLYAGQQIRRNVQELFSVPIDGSASPVRLNGDLVDGGLVHDLFVRPDATHALYLAEQDVDGVRELYSAPIDGSAPPVKLNPPLGGTRTINPAVAPDTDPAGARAFYISDPYDAGAFELFGAATDGSAPPQRLNGPLVLGPSQSNVVSFKANDERVVYLGDLVRDEHFELFSTSLEQPGAGAVRISGEGNVEGDVVEYLVKRATDRVVYRADQDLDGVIELFSVPDDGSAAPVKLNPPLAAGQLVSACAITLDSAGVLFLANADPAHVELFRAPIAGGGPARALSGPLVAGGDVQPHFFQRGARVVYRADAAVDGMLELYSVPVDGSAAPIRLSGPSVPLGDVSTFAVAPNASRVVYRADQDVDEHHELYSVPLDGGSAPVRLDPALPASGDVTGFTLDPTARYAVFVADRDVDTRVELYSVPVDGSAAPLRLNSTLAPAADVETDVRVTPDGRRVLYRADPNVLGVKELFSVPIDGSAAAVRLNLPMTAGDVVFHVLSPLGDRVVFTAGPMVTFVGQVQDLYSAPVDGSAPAVLIRPFTIGPVRFSMSPGGRQVAYLEMGYDDPHERGVFLVPIDGGSAERISPEFAGGEIEAVRFLPDGAGVLYQVSQELPRNVELFLSELERVAPVQPPTRFVTRPR